MNYTLKIIDTQDSSHVTKVEKTKGGSVVLEWMGGDQKDELFIVGSRMSLTMVGMSMEDGQYLDLFTGDETRYKLVQEDENGKIEWQGFLLPDSYSEPYTNSPILVDFQATDGLGRLKGKYLPEDFYKEEKSVIQIIAQCLKLTGLDLYFRFAPAIENSQQKDYDKIYIDTSLFKDKDKKQDAYKILDDLLQSMLCTLYQAENHYNIEGLNVRNFRVYTAKIYSPSGTLTDTVEITRNKKAVTGIQPTYFSAQPPYGVINVTHKREVLALPETLYKEENDGWLLQEGQEEIGIYATDWFGHDGCYALASADDGGVGLLSGGVSGSTGYVSLRQRPFVQKGIKYRLQLSFKGVLLFQDEVTQDERETDISQGKWDNPMYYEIVLDYEKTGGTERQTLFSNIDALAGEYKDLNFKIDQKGEVVMYFIPNYSGTLDIELHAPHKSFLAIMFEKISLSRIGDKEEYFTEILSDNDFTLKKEIDLVYGGDVNGLSNSFRLQKLNVKNKFNIISIPIIRQRPKSGYWYATVDLKGANLIKENIKDVSVRGESIYIYDVLYNYNNSEEHAVKLDEFIEDIPLGSTPQFEVKVYDYNSVTENRDHWEEWSDARYGIERKRYPEVVAEVIEKLHKKPIYNVEFQVKNNIKFSDIIDFDFKGDREFMLTNCRWNIDTGFSEIRGSEAFYDVTKGENIPPIVEAGPDIYIGNKDTFAALSCEAYDPDGFIASYLWEEVTNNGIPSRTSQNPLMTGLYNDYYEFKITVTDNDGATASDIVKVYRTYDVNVTLEDYYDNSFWDGDVAQRDHYFRLTVDKDIGESTINFKGRLYIEEENAQASITVKLNGIEHIFLNANVDRTFSISYNQGDEILFLTSTRDYDGLSTYRAEIDLTEADFVVGSGEVTGLPISVANYM